MPHETASSLSTALSPHYPLTVPIRALALPCTASLSSPVIALMAPTPPCTAHIPLPITTPSPLAPVILTLGPNHTDGHQQQEVEAQDQQIEPEPGVETLQQKGLGWRCPCKKRGIRRWAAESPPNGSTRGTEVCGSAAQVGGRKVVGECCLGESCLGESMGFDPGI